MNNIPEGADLDVRNPCLDEDDIEDVESLNYEYWKEELNYKNSKEEL